MSEQLLVRHRGEIVGTLTDDSPNMSFLPGRFTPADTPAASRFVRAACAVDPSTSMEDPRSALRAYLLTSPAAEGTTFIVLSLTGDMLFGRRVFDSEGVEWAEANVPE